MADSTIIEEVLLKYEDPGEFLLSELQEMCHADSLFCDVDFCCKDRQIIQAHSALLAVVSPFLKSILTDIWVRLEEIISHYVEI